MTKRIKKYIASAQRLLNDIFFVFPKIKDFYLAVKHYIGGFYRKLDTHHLFIYAGGLAFSIFLCIIPFILILFWVLGNFLNSSSVEFQINLLIETIIPYESYAEFVKSIITKRIQEIVTYKNVAGYVGAVGLLFAASGLFASLRTILNTIFGEKDDESILKGKLKDLLFIIIIMSFFILSTFLLPLIEVLRSFSQEIFALRFLQYGIFQKAFLSAISLIVLYLLFVVIYRFVPKHKIQKKAARIGAIWAAVLWEGAKQLFGIYIYNYASFGLIYGTYALVIVVAFWIYYSAIVFIIGAEIGKLYDERLILKKNQPTLFSS